MKKYSIAIIMLLLFSCFMISCDSYTTYKSSGNSTSSSWNMSYEKFNGKQSKDISLDSPSTLNFDVTTYDGTLSVVIQDKDKNVIYESDNIATSNFKVSIDNKGKYKIILNAKNHNGSFDISW